MPRCRVAMNLLIDNNDGLGQQDYTAWVDAEHLPADRSQAESRGHHDGGSVAADPAFIPR